MLNHEKAPVYAEKSRRWKIPHKLGKVKWLYEWIGVVVIFMVYFIVRGICPKWSNIDHNTKNSSF
jgi:hypothetical protein